MSTVAAIVPTSVVVPKGYRILVRVCKPAEKTAGGLYKPDALVEKEMVAASVGKVVALGTDAYQNKERFPFGAWCQIGDYVMFRAYAGSRFTVDGVEYRLLNDDTIEGVTTAPESIER